MRLQFLPYHMYTESVHYVIKKRRTLGVLAVMLAIVRWRRRRRHYSLRMSRRKYGPLVDRDLERQKKLNDLYNSTDKNCISQLRTTGPLRSGFDDVNKQVMLSQSTLDGLSFYDKLKELFSGSSADGSFMQDPFSAAETDNDDKVKDDMMNDMSTFVEAKGPTGHDSDKLDTDSDDCEAVAALAATDSQVSSSNVAALKPNKKSFKKSAKPNTLPPPQNDKAKRSKPRSSQASQDDTNMDVLLTSTLMGIRETLASPVQTVAPKDPNAPLWDMLKKIPLPPDERMSVGMHLCKPEFAVHRGFLVSMGQEYLERWVYTYLSDNYPAGKRVGDDLVGNLGNKDPASNLGDDPVVNSTPF
ncbi:uncharacterized protein LOC119287263 isoform X2 [Triticum dicoccoides]|uniref:uncharacterized protein LOC119287263 isoform X2 n=1 Tax=Triticum dicoccoides TaxID=85692 RepID=UPI00188E92C0|nr:uncharacterized protein LOC119287263 isoform X2 [Triticum dicoccoides]